MDLFTPLTLGAMQLRNRIIMAPMTRSRAEANGLPSELMLEYYRQRAGAGLIISEGIAPSADGLGYCRTPGIYNEEQTAMWKRITDAVHAQGGSIVAQIMHVGRISNALNKPAGSETVAPSAIRARGELYTDTRGMQPMDQPRALATDEVPQVIEQYRQATENAFVAGFDGVELHCTSGYLPAQFLSSGSNKREDQYGGSAANRCRFALETLATMISVDGPGRVGIRICPDNPFNDIQDDNPRETYEYLLDEADAMDLAYLHVIRFPGGRIDNIELGQRHFGDRLIGNDSYSYEEAQMAVARGELTAVSFGRAFIANPDLPRRWQLGLPLEDFDPGGLYASGPEGYTAYPAAAD